VAGVSLLEALSLTEGDKLAFTFDLSSFQYFNAQTDRIFIGVNVVAFYLVYFIIRAQDKLTLRQPA
jgi:hypothetical protein